MALRTRLELRQVQRLGLSAGVLVSLNILRLSAAELAEALAREAETNPFLLPGLPAPAQTASLAQDDGVLDQLVAQDPDWQIAVLRQIAQLTLPSGIARIAAVLVTELDDRGWLDSPLDQIADARGLAIADLEQALQVVQGCEPVGVGARDLDECLRLQLVGMGLSEPEARDTLAQLPLFARRDWPGLSRTLGLTRAEVMARAGLLRRVAANPVGSRSGPAPVLRPDLVLVRRAMGIADVELAQDHVPRPSIDLELARRAEAEGFGADLLDRARAMVRATDSRGGTLLKIGQWLVRRQEAALRDGPGALRAASRAECAGDLGLHPSTVGRAVSGKALQADGRLWPLNALFSGAAPGSGDRVQDGPPPAAARAVAHRIAALIAAEPAARPRSDQAIAQILATEGVDIARRTVAKYRSGLHIPPAHLRRGRE